MSFFKKACILAIAISFLFFTINPVQANIILSGGVKLRGGTRFVRVSEAGGGGEIAAEGVIGVPGSQGFGVGVCPENLLLAGLSPMSGYDDTTSANYGNYQYSDGSVMCFIPKFYYKIGTGSNGLDVNVIDVKGIDTFISSAEANASGYALHRAFIDGGVEKSGFFIDKYMCSNNGGVASSIKNGNPISIHADHNPIADLTACSGNYYYEVINAAHARGELFNVSSKFMYSALAILSMAHGDATEGTAYCAWYDAGGVMNFPKGCNNNLQGDRNDSSVSYTSDGFMGCGKTGSGTPFAKTTHNGQVNGVADLNGLLWEIALGLTRPGTGLADDSDQNDANAFYVLKESSSLRNLQAGWHSGASDASFEAWGDAEHLSLYYDVVSIPQITSSGTLHKFGSGSNQVLSEAVNGTAWLFTGLGIPKDNNGNDSTGTTRFGNDYFYEYHCANLVVLVGGSFLHDGAGVWGVGFNQYCSYSNNTAGFRAACYPHSVM